jgi:peptidase M28-like protein
MRATVRFVASIAGVAVVACAKASAPPVNSVAPSAVADAATPASVGELLRVIADDSMEGRAVWTKGSDRAAAYIGSRMRIIGLVPGGDSGYFQRIAGAARTVIRPRRIRENGPNGRPVIRTVIVNGDTVRDTVEVVTRLANFSDWDSIPASRRRLAVNVVGLLPGTGLPIRADSIVLVDAHYDHLGAAGRPGGNCQPTGADSICNGADDDASGTVAVLEIARIMSHRARPARTVVFVTTTGEEFGLVGTSWYLEHPVRPLAAMSSNLEIEMIGRPDSLAGPRGYAWLTGFERSTMGETFQANGLHIVPDKRPTQSFFTRSDNIAFARKGIPAHTLSSFNLHTDYHRATDDVDKIDFVHMAAVINAGAHAVEILANGPAPQWKPGGKP